MSIGVPSPAPGDVAPLGPRGDGHDDHPMIAGRRTGLPDLARRRSILVIGVGGAGMSALAVVLAGMGHRVRGTDLRDSPLLDVVRAAGVDVRIGHDRANLDGIELVTVSTAIPNRNLEVQTAYERSIPVLHRSKLLGAITAAGYGIGVAGAHGKTTTSSMLTMILATAGLDPSFVIGAEVNEVGTGARWSGPVVGAAVEARLDGVGGAIDVPLDPMTGPGDVEVPIVIEADESDGTFLDLVLRAAIVTNVEVDHLDHWATFDALVAGYERFVDEVDGPVVVCADDDGASRLGVRARHGAVTYGWTETADYAIGDWSPTAGGQRFTITGPSGPLGEVQLPLRGRHMAANATGAAALALQLGAPFGAAQAALARFGGVARRFELRGTRGGATLVDDYAHLPTEIAATLRAARTGADGWTRVIAVFQPNRFTRMAVLSPEYRDAFVDADVIVLTDVYPSGEPPLPGVTGKLVVNAVLDAHPTARVVYLPHRADLVGFLAGELRSGDVCISMGCGDVSGLPDEVIAEWDRRDRG